MATIPTIKVGRGDASYPIIIGNDNLPDLGRAIRAFAFGGEVFLITDSIVGDLYKDKAIKALLSAGINEIKTEIIPAGEREKNIGNWIRLLESIADFDNALNKQLIIVNLGGGVVGDLGGFVASAYRRGINYVQVPTTLLSNVDSAVGGKVAVNFKQGKNLVGAFYQPKMVFVDLSLMKSLPLSEIKAGLAEVVKYGIIADRELFAFLENYRDSLTNCDLIALEHVVKRSYEIKAGIVELDERDTKGIRAKLNFGHTVGHAIEAVTKYEVYKHGEAVAIGMVCAADLAVSLGIFAPNQAARLEKLLSDIGLPVHIRHADLSDIMSAMSHDKKFINKRNRFVLPVAIGEVAIIEDIDEGLIQDVITARFA